MNITTYKLNTVFSSVVYSTEKTNILCSEIKNDYFLLSCKLPAAMWSDTTDRRRQVTYLEV